MTRRQQARFDWRWVAIIFFLVLALGLALYKNIHVDKDSTTNIQNSLVIDNSDLKINWDRYQTTEIKLSESLNITKSGTYHLTGELKDGNIVIDAGISEVRLILDNATISSSNGPAILCHNAENLVIELRGESTISDSENYSNIKDEDIRGTVYSKADLAFTGTGTLNINAKYQDGIVAKDDVKFNSGIYNINAKSNAILGKDSIYVVGGSYNLISDNDSMKTTNIDDFGKGFILIENGTFSINSLAKGLESANCIVINSGNIDIDSFDDAIHARNYVGLKDGVISITSGDDAIHADKEVTLDGGWINIVKSFEGIEAETITINSGELSIRSTDDGINAGNSIDGSTTNHNPSTDQSMNTDENCKVVFNGGSTYINSVGDGIDSNGHVIINDGIIIVDGPIDSKNGALDSGLGFITNGGTVIAVGSSEMASNLGEKSNALNLSVYFSEVQPADTKIEIKDSQDKILLSHTSTKEFSHLAATTPDFIIGETYDIYINDKKTQSFTISSMTTIINEA